MVEKMAKLFYAYGKILEPTLSEAVRACIHFTKNEFYKAIEVDRHAR